MSDENNNSHTQVNHALETVGNLMVRFVLAQCESQTGNTVITRSKMLQKLKEIIDEEKVKSIPFSTVYGYVDDKLNEIFEYHLFGVLAKKTDKRSFSQTQDEGTPDEANNSVEDAKARGNHFILVRSGMEAIPQRYHKFILDHASAIYRKTVHQVTYIGKEYSASSNPTLDNEIGNNTELALKGIIAITICIVIFSKNNILETELSDQHGKFGISTEGHDIPIIDMNHKDLLNLLVRNNYLTRTVEKAADLGQELAIYSIGKRTLVEFPKESLTKMCQEMLDLDDSQLELIENTVNVLAGDAYGAFRP